MNRLLTSFSFIVAVMATTAFAAGAQATLGGPTLLGTASAPALQAPTPLSDVPAAPSDVPAAPAPEVQYSGPAGQLPVVTAPTIELFKCVKYRGKCNIAPCAVPVVVQVPDPCVPRDRCCGTPRPCVYVEICVPSNCGCPTVCVTRHGNKTRYDYGKYAINVISLNGRVVVDYDD